MITRNYLKQTVEQAEFNCSGNHVDYDITDIIELSEEGAYLILASAKKEGIKTSFVAYEDGVCYFLSDWQGSYPATEEEIAEYKDWMTVDLQRTPFVFNGLPRVL